MSLPIYQKTVVDDNGDVQPFADYTVLNEGNGFAQTIYSDRAGTTVISGPTYQADENGDIEFYVEPGEYAISVTSGGVTKAYRYQLVTNLPPVVTQIQGRSINFMTYSASPDENTIVLTPIGNGSATLVDGDIVNFRATATNTGAVTINGEATETVTGSVLPAGYIRDDAPTKLMWNAVTSKFRVYREMLSESESSRTYTQFEDGTMMQSGTHSATAGDTSVTYWKPFSSVTQPPNVTMIGSTDSDILACSVFNAATTGFSVDRKAYNPSSDAYGDAGQPITWYITGRWYD